jgi:aspartate aminotransferase
MSNPTFSRLANTLIGSEIVKLGGIIKEKIRQGQHIYNYTIGDFDSSIFPIPDVLREEIIRAYQEGYTTYPAADGEADLRTAVAAFLKRKEGLDYSIDEILISNGGRPLIYAIFRSIVDKGDKVIYPLPSWNNNHYTHFTEGIHVQIEANKENNFMPTAEQIKPHLKGATLLAICSPLNPTGTVFSKSDLEAICDLVIEENNSRAENEKKLYVMYDQIYWTLTYGTTKHYNPVELRPEMKAYTIFVDGISKALAATGVRVGWTMGPKALMEKIKAINSHIGSWAPMAEQKAVAAFLRNESAVDAYLSGFKDEIEFRLNHLYHGFIQLKEEGFSVDAIAPQAAIYLTVQANLRGRKTSDGHILETQEDVTNYILNEARLAMVPFSSFGASRENSWYRISVGCAKKDELGSVIEQLRNALVKLN